MSPMAGYSGRVSLTAVALTALVAVSPAPGGAQAPDEALAERAVRELAALRAGITPAQWLNDHPRDGLRLFSHTIDDRTHSEWCARATSHHSMPDGTILLRHAYFYVPEAPADLALPSPADGATLAHRQCALGAIWVEVPHADSQAGRRRADRLIARLRSSHGAPGTPGEALNFRGSAYWSPYVAWHAGGTTMVAALDTRTWEDTPKRVIAVAFLPTSTIGRAPSTWFETSHAREVWAAGIAEQAAALSESPPGQIEGLLDFHRSTVAANYSDAGHTQRDALKARLVPTLRGWLAGSPGWPAARRAAALVAADVILGAAQWVITQDEDSLDRRQLQNLGARFAYSPLGAAHLYAHSWLREALPLDPDGRAGELAFLLQLDRGFDFTGMCDANSGATRVIAEGESFLGTLGDSGERARVHFLLAAAHAEVVGLADGISEYEEADPYSDDVAPARMRAIAHYRRGLELDRESYWARVAWGKVWRLRAGLPPLDLRFYCVYD